MLTLGEKQKKLYNKIGVSYNEMFKSNLFVEDLDRLSKHLSKGDKVLDVACAGGRDTNYFSKIGLDAVGLDFSHTEIEYAKESYPAIKFIEGDLLCLVNIFGVDHFDAIYSCATLDHLTNRDIPKAILQFNKVLRLNGKMLIKTKAGKGILKTVDKYSSGLERRFTLVRPEVIRKMILRLGFEILEFEIQPSRTRNNINFIIILCKKIRNI